MRTKSRGSWRSFASTIIAVLVVSWPVSSMAETLAAPVGGKPIPLGADRIVCPEGIAGVAPWTVEADRKSVRPPARDDATGQSVTVHVAANDAACAAASAPLSLTAVGPEPSVDAPSVVVDADAGRVTLHGKKLKGVTLVWTSGAKHGADTCATPETVGATESCAFALPRDLPADAASLDLTLLPAGLRPGQDVTFHDLTGKRASRDDRPFHPAQVIVSRLVPIDTAVDVSTGAARTPLVHPEAIASVDCIDATCDISDGALVVRNEHGADDKLDVHMQLRPHVMLKSGQSNETAPVVSVPLQRCPIALASAAPPAGSTDPRVVLRLGAACARGDGDIELSTPTGVATIERSEVIGGDRFIVVRAGRIDADTTLRARRRGTVVGLVTVAPQRSLVARAALEISKLGAIDFVPTNRWARMTLPPPPRAGTLVPVAAEGAYEIRHDADGYFVRGADGAAGSTVLRFALVDPSLPAPLTDTKLAELSEPLDRALRVANVPLPVGALAREEKPLVEVDCGDGEGHVKKLPPQTTAFIPYRARETCQLVIHREQLSDEDGAQAFQVSVSISASDGAARAEGRVDRKLVLKKADKPAYVAITGVSAPFDRIIVRAGLADDENHYAVSPPEKSAAQAQWTIIAGTDRFRIYGTAAIPTGLFRVADTGHSGILTLSVGALIRGVVLSKEGVEFPVGLEAGVMWLGVAGDTDPSASSRGAVALVVGPGISVPIANVSRSTQTSIALHAWFEYEVSRNILNQSGQAYGFVFGPSISIGDVGTNL